MTLVRPDVGSVGWGDGVNLNFQTLEDFCNGLPGNLPAGSIAQDRLQAGSGVVALAGSMTPAMPLVVWAGTVTLAAGVALIAPGGVYAFVFAWYDSPKAATSPPIVLSSGDSGLQVANGDAGDDVSIVAWVAVQGAS